MIISAEFSTLRPRASLLHITCCCCCFCLHLVCWRLKASSLTPLKQHLFIVITPHHCYNTSAGGTSAHWMRLFPHCCQGLGRRPHLPCVELYKAAAAAIAALRLVTAEALTARVWFVRRSFSPALQYTAAVKGQLAQPQVHQLVQPAGPCTELSCAA
jgi:hypothetical protein